ncbi:MAG: cupin domain-containing protein [Myxococcales bacterium]|nr:cupin domain-containing protein [Myxococcales bacterium]
MKFDLAKHPVHLGLGATAVRLRSFERTREWYEDYGEAFADDGTEGRLVALHTFTEDWPTWEVHPLGAELVYVIAGKMTLLQSDEGVRTELVLEAGEAAINPPGVWHTAKVSEPTTALFITAGLGTRNEPEPPG